MKLLKERVERRALGHGDGRTIGADHFAPAAAACEAGDGQRDAHLRGSSWRLPLAFQSDDGAVTSHPLQFPRLSSGVPARALDV